MARVRHVDPAMLQRTRTWLLGQRDGKGGYARKTHTLHTWLAEPEVANSYNTWALLEAKVEGDSDGGSRLGAGRRRADAEHLRHGPGRERARAWAASQEGANHLLDKLAGKQTEDGSLTGATTSVVGSGGEALTIETTALAVLAWLKNPALRGQRREVDQVPGRKLQGGPVRLDAIHRPGAAGHRGLRPVAGQAQSAGHAAVGRRRIAGGQAGRIHRRHARAPSNCRTPPP